MSKKKKIIPKLRFPEFEKEGEWEEKKISEQFKSFSGGTPNTSRRDYYGGDIPFIRSAEIAKEKTELFITEEGLKHSSAKLVNRGDLLVALYGANSGDSAISKINGAINQAILCLKSDYSNVFVCNYLTLKKDQFISKFIQGGQGNLSGEIVKSIKIPFPNKKEQQKIAACLSSLDELIAAHRQKLELLQEHKKGLLQNLFPQEGETVPKLRFPEFENDGDWEEKKLGEIFTIGNGKDYKHLKEGNIPVYGSGGYMHSVNDFLYDGKSACIGRKGTIDKPMFLTGKFWTVDTLFYTYDFKNCTPEFVYNIFLNVNWIKHNEAGGVPSLSKKNIYQIRTALPPTIEEQQKIATCLSSLDELITAETAEIDILEQHKKGLMQGLFPKTENDE